jgi:MrfA Zn-binding domain
VSRRSAGSRGRRRPPVFGELRPSQIITTFGPGSVVDLRNASVVIAGTDFWATSPEQQIDEPRLRNLLSVSRFYRPPVKSDGGAAGIPAFLFPRYLRCPRCGRLGRHDRTDLFLLDGRRYRCRGSHEGKVPKKGPPIFPARFVIACTEGHLDDFPWHEYVHRGKETEACRPEMLFLRESAQSAALKDLIVRCERCPAWRNMEDAFGPRSQKAIGSCSGASPWLGLDREEPCTRGTVRTTLRGASNIYFSLVQSALSIPDWDDPIQGAIAHHEEQLQGVSSVADIELGIEKGFLPSLKGFAAVAAFAALQRRRELGERSTSQLDIRREEFGALGAVLDTQVAAHREFRTEHMEVPSEFAALIGRLVIVRRLREVRALAGFTRVDFPFDVPVDEDDQQRYRIQGLSGEQLNWRPAVDLRGEGVFIEFREDALQPWESSDPVSKRTASMERAHTDWRQQRELPAIDYPGARFVMLHSLAHLLILGLSLDSGYSSSSIRERIYSSSDTASPMAGILLYTATPDSDGSLGGLADKGHPDKFGPLLREILDQGLFCSSDPLCGHAAPGEIGHLNGAACHACLLVSETSCERGNRYLDRAHLVMTVAQLGTNFFPISIPTPSSRT